MFFVHEARSRNNIFTKTIGPYFIWNILRNEQKTIWTALHKYEPKTYTNLPNFKAFGLHPQGLGGIPGSAGGSCSDRDQMTGSKMQSKHSSPFPLPVPYSEGFFIKFWIVYIKGFCVYGGLLYSVQEHVGHFHFG